MLFALVKKGEHILCLLTYARLPICSLIILQCFEGFTNLLVITGDLELLWQMCYK